MVRWYIVLVVAVLLLSLFVILFIGACAREFHYSEDEKDEYEEDSVSRSHDSSDF